MRRHHLSLVLSYLSFKFSLHIQNKIKIGYSTYYLYIVCTNIRTNNKNSFKNVINKNVIFKCIYISFSDILYCE